MNFRPLVLLLLIVAPIISACASNGHIAHHSFGFDVRRSKPSVEILDYRYGSSGTPGTRAPEWAVRQGITGGSDGASGAIRVGESLYVKWRIKETGEVFEETVDLKGRLPWDMEDHSVYFDIKGSQLFVYLVSPLKRPKDVPPNGPRIYHDRLVKTIYPDSFEE